MLEQQTQAAASAAEGVEALPSVVGRAMEVMYDSRAGARELADVIGLDPALAGRLLRLVNSPYYRTLSRPVVSLTECILRLGYRSVQSALLTAATAGLLRPSLPHYGLRGRQFWQHSVAVAIAAREISRRSDRERVEEAYVAGLLHDIGKVGMDRRQSGAMAAVEHQVHERNVPYHIAEADLLGFDHARVGELVAERWGLSADTVVAIGAHHRPEAVGGLLSATVASADAVAWLMGFPGTGDPVPRQIDGAALASLKLTPSALEDLIGWLAPMVGETLGSLAADGAFS